MRICQIQPVQMFYSAGCYYRIYTDLFNIQYRRHPRPHERPSSPGIGGTQDNRAPLCRLPACSRRDDCPSRADRRTSRRRSSYMVALFGERTHSIFKGASPIFANEVTVTGRQRDFVYGTPPRPVTVTFLPLFCDAQYLQAPVGRIYHAW